MEGMASIFSKEEIQRYSRHLIIPEFNIEGQRRLKSARVLVVGGGGLGSPLLQYLAAAGIGTIGIVDYDKVDDSNLQRQVLYGAESVGKLKVEEAKKRILSLNPHIHVETYPTHLYVGNAMEILRDYDIVADGTDNFPTRYLVNDACVLLDKINVYASIFRFEGQVSVFNYLEENGERGPNYRDLFPTPPPPGLVPSCAEGGVLGVLPGIIGSMQALEVIKIAAGIGEVLSGRMFLFDALEFTTKTLKIRKDDQNPLTGTHPTQKTLIDYEAFCGSPAFERPQAEEDNSVPEMTVSAFEKIRQSGKAFQLIDVREPHEFEIVSLGGAEIPLGELALNFHQVAQDRPVIVHCRTGIRSAKAVKALKDHFPTLEVYNLSGGIVAYAQEIQPELPVY